jgi:phage shock protein PspC (stress-responsive transcriptional regulator)
MARAGSGRALGGVAAGLAEHLGLRPLPVRAAFVLLALFGGMGVALYAALWLLVPMSQARGPRRTDDRVQLLALSALGIGGLLLLQGAGITSPALLPLLFVGGGVALVWRQVDEAQRQRWRSARGRGPLAC